MIAASAFLPKLLDTIDAADPPAAAPADLCAALGQALFERLVPYGVPQTQTIYSTGPDAACDHRTPNNRQADPDAYGSLHVRLLRYSRVGWHSPSGRASHAFAESCDNSAIGGSFQHTSGIADEACVAYQEESDSGSGSAIVRRGADLFWVDNQTHLGTVDSARRAVADVVSAFLAAVP
ncbi:hypothetical protein GPX89_17130 [Nocardia sp. ET3-3]|uniref:Uncharacterized protein n=1 Tax=Nocardia terrae TaxID=2675851 RepID=A0A7K1UX53_9NOCA|nr:hypothetical protein [Nocardia terrae]MVU78963.1 hypothetical protein [Nocardia terrae]